MQIVVELKLRRVIYLSRIGIQSFLHVYLKSPRDPKYSNRALSIESTFPYQSCTSLREGARSKMFTWVIALITSGLLTSDRYSPRSFGDRGLDDAKSSKTNDAGNAPRQKCNYDCRVDCHYGQRKCMFFLYSLLFFFSSLRGRERLGALDSA